MGKKLNQISLLGLLISACCGHAIADDGQWKLGTGIDFSSGDYGGDPIDTDITYIPFNASYQTGAWKFKATIPWVQITGPGTVVGAGDGGVVVANNSNTQVRKTTESGLGDIWLSGTYALDAIPAEFFYLDLTGKVKLPTADEDKGLGTGETDYTLQADLFKPLGRLTPFATVPYKIKGDPDGVDLENVFYLSGGTSYKVSNGTSVGASLDFQEAASEFGDDSLDVFTYVNQKINPKWSVTLYGYKGLEDGSPDYGLGLQTTYKP